MGNLWIAAANCDTLVTAESSLGRLSAPRIMSKTYSMKRHAVGNPPVGSSSNAKQPRSSAPAKADAPHPRVQPLTTRPRHTRKMPSKHNRSGGRVRKSATREFRLSEKRLAIGRERERRHKARFDSTLGYPGEGPFTQCTESAPHLFIRHYHKRKPTNAARRVAERTMQKSARGNKPSPTLCVVDKCNKDHLHDLEQITQLLQFTAEEKVPLFEYKRAPCAPSTPGRASPIYREESSDLSDSDGGWFDDYSSLAVDLSAGSDDDSQARGLSPPPTPLFETKFHSAVTECGVSPVDQDSCVNHLHPASAGVTKPTNQETHSFPPLPEGLTAKERRSHIKARIQACYADRLWNPFRAPALTIPAETKHAPPSPPEIKHAPPPPVTTSTAVVVYKAPNQPPPPLSPPPEPSPPPSSPFDLATYVDKSGHVTGPAVDWGETEVQNIHDGERCDYRRLSFVDKLLGLIRTSLGPSSVPTSDSGHIDPRQRKVDASGLHYSYFGGLFETYDTRRSRIYDGYSNYRNVRTGHVYTHLIRLLKRDLVVVNSRGVNGAGYNTTFTATVQYRASRFTFGDPKRNIFQAYWTNQQVFQNTLHFVSNLKYVTGVRDESLRNKLIIERVHTVPLTLSSLFAMPDWHTPPPLPGDHPLDFHRARTSPTRQTIPGQRGCTRSTSPS